MAKIDKVTDFLTEQGYIHLDGLYNKSSKISQLEYHETIEIRDRYWEFRAEINDTVLGLSTPIIYVDEFYHAYEKFQNQIVEHIKDVGAMVIARSRQIMDLPQSNDFDTNYPDFETIRHNQFISKLTSTLVAGDKAVIELLKSFGWTKSLLSSNQQ